MHPLYIGRIYESAPTPSYRLLVDRLWPRGISKNNPPWDEWVKELAPSADLRKWFHAHRDLYDDFSAAYLRELQNPVVRPYLDQVKLLLEKTPVQLLTFSRSVDQSHVPILRQYLVGVG